MDYVAERASVCLPQVACYETGRVHGEMLIAA